MARIRITLEDDDGREINGDKERLYDLSGGAKRLVDIESARLFAKFEVRVRVRYKGLRAGY